MSEQYPRGKLCEGDQGALNLCWHSRQDGHHRLRKRPVLDWHAEGTGDQFRQGDLGKGEPDMKLFALFHNGKQISKPHSTRHAVRIEAISMNAAGRYKGGIILLDGYEIREVP
jgi:hypothetical protein